MEGRTCYATADTPRAVLALVAPVLAVAAGIIIFDNDGYIFSDYFILLESGALSWVRQGVGWLALAVWVVRYFPPAWTALWNGPCLVSGDEQNLYLPNGRRVPLANVRSVRVQRGVLRKVADFDTIDGGFDMPLLFVRASSDALLRGLEQVSPARG